MFNFPEEEITLLLFSYIGCVSNKKELIINKVFIVKYIYCLNNIIKHNHDDQNVSLSSYALHGHGSSC